VKTVTFINQRYLAPIRSIIGGTMIEEILSGAAIACVSAGATYLIGVRPGVLNKVSRAKISAGVAAGALALGGMFCGGAYWGKNSMPNETRYSIENGRLGIEVGPLESKNGGQLFPGPDGSPYNIRIGDGLPEDKIETVCGSLGSNGKIEDIVVCTAAGNSGKEQSICKEYDKVSGLQSSGGKKKGSEFGLSK